MKTLVKLILLVFLNLNLSPSISADKIRAVQVFTFSAPDSPGLLSELNQIKNAGFNTVIIRVFKNPYDTPYRFVEEKFESGVYYESEREPVVADVLSVVVKHAHSLNLKVFAWITTRKSSWILKENADWDSPTLDPFSNSFSSGGHLDVFRSDIEQRLSDILVELAQKGIDGILIQDDFVSRQYEDLNTNAWRSFSGHRFNASDTRELFTVHKGKTTYRSRFYHWTRHKSRVMSNILSRWIVRVKSNNPEVKIAVNLYYETVTAPHHARLWLSQDLEEFSQLPVDYWAIMAYQEQISKELNLSETMVADLLKKSRQRLENSYLMHPNTLLWKFQSHDWETGDVLASQEFTKLLGDFSEDQWVIVPYRGLISLQHVSGF